LAARKTAIAFVRRLNPIVVRTINERIVRVFGLAEMARLVRSSEGREVRVDRVEDRVDVTRELADGTKRASVAETDLLDNPWRPWVPESDPIQLDCDQQLLVGIGLMLIRAPSVVRSRQFGRKAAAWQKAIIAKNDRSPNKALGAEHRETRSRRD
jgi:hypothetical protein